jgi:hypothetical protein
MSEVLRGDLNRHNAAFLVSIRTFSVLVTTTKPPELKYCLSLGTKEVHRPHREKLANPYTIGIDFRNNSLADLSLL